MIIRGPGTVRRRRRVAVAAVFAPLVTVVATVSAALPADAASLTVTTAADVVADDGVCSLREAIEAADSDTASGVTAGECAAGSGPDVITFGVAGPIVGASFTIDSEVTIDGGVEGISIDGGSDVVAWTGPVFEVTGHASFESVTITGGGDDGTARRGGGIYNTGSVSVVNSSIHGNFGVVGAGIMNDGGTVEVLNSTLSNNIAFQPSAIYNSGTVMVEFSTLAGNGYGIGHVPGASTTVIASIHDGVFGSGGGVSIDATSLYAPAANLGPLADNGGPTLTHLPAHDSLAIGRVTAAVGTDPSVDQRGVARPQGAAKDTGAVEREDLWVRPFGAVLYEGDSGTTTADVVVYLEDGNGDPTTSTFDVTVDFATVDVFPNPAVAQAGSDFISTSGTLTIPAGASQATVPVEVIGDTVYEPDLLYGEWGLVVFSNPSPNARLNLGFFGLGLFIIGNDDPPPV